MDRITTVIPTSASAEGKGSASSSSRAPAGLCPKGLTAKRDLAAPSKPQSALCFQRQLRIRPSQLSEFTVIYLLLSIKPWGARDLDLGFSDPPDAGRVWDRGTSPSPSPALPGLGSQSESEWEPQSYTLCAPSAL